MANTEDHELAFFAGSPVRASILERLAEGAAQPSTLVDHTGASRTTIHRTLSELVDRNWARRTDGGYVVTGTGSLALEIYRTARTQFRTLERVEPLLSATNIPLEDDLEPAWLETATVVTAVKGNPHRPLEWYADRLETVDGDHLRGVTPVMSRQFMAAHAPIVFGGIPTELVVGEQAFRAVCEQYSTRLRESISLEGYELYVADEEPLVGIALFGDRVFLGAYEGGRLLALVESADDRLRSWATDRFRDSVTGSRRVTESLVRAEAE